MNWTSPYCQRPQVVTSNNNSAGRHSIRIGYEKDELAGLRSVAIACLNADCRKMTLSASLHKRDDTDPIHNEEPPRNSGHCSRILTRSRSLNS